MKNKNIDLIKGILILLVITGHFLKGSLNENLARYIIYSFHMPLLIAIAGYLFNPYMGGISGMKKLFSYYKSRIIVPWIIAVLFYFFVFNLDYYKNIVHIVISLIGKFVIPYFHLWFICGFLSYVIYLWFFRNYFKKFLFLFVSFLFSTFLYLVHFHIPFWWSDAETLSEKFLSIFLYTFRDYFLIFFVFGYFLREKYNNFNKIAMTVFSINFILNILAFYYKLL